jgi:subtilisin family serine protease
MNWSRIWPWGSPRAKPAPLRRSPSVARLWVECLEERLVPSTTVDDAAYEAWRQQTYSVDELSVAESLVSIVGPTQVDSQATNNSFGSLIGLPSVFNTPYRGTGYSVVVIDTGIDYRHTDLGGGFGAGKRVIAGWDFVNNDADPLDDNGHGTHVAGIIGSSSSTYSGVAPGVNLIALKVLDKNGSGTFGAVEDALKWVAANQSKYNIVSINLSLGAGNYTTNPYTFLDDEFTALRNQGVFLAVAAGNSFYSYNSQIGLDFPAVNPLVVSVGAVWSGNFGSVAWGSGARDNTTAADRIASFTQRGPGLSIMAPGAIINSTYLNNTYKTMAGTSMASPVVAAAAAILHQAMDARNLTANQDTILTLMRSTADNVVDGDDENDNVVNTGLTFKRLDLAAALGALGSPSNSAPVLQAIGAKSVAPGKATVVTLNATDADNDPIAYTAQVIGSSASQAYQLKQQLSLSFNDSYYFNAWGQNEKWLGGANGAWYCILPNGEFRRWSGSMGATLQPANLVATFDASYHADPSLLFDAQAASGAQPTLSIAGRQLTIQAPAGASGSYQIRVTASDGKATAQQVFALTITNSKPVLQPIANQAIAPGKSQTITISANDADGDPLTYSATVVSSLAAQAYQLKQQYRLGYSGNYYQNAWGQNEKWFSTPTGFFFCILPNGELRRWTGNMNTTLQTANLIATLDTIAYDDPALIWNAQSANSADPVISFAGNQMTIQAPSGGLNSFQIRVTVSDGAGSSQQLFTLTLKNNKPVLQAISNQTVGAGQTLSVNVAASDADGDTLTYSARIVSSLASQALELKQKYQLGFSGNYYQNAWGQNEKWFSTPTGFYFCILPNGELRRWTGNMSTTLQAANLVATLDTAYHTDPSLLWNAKPQSAAPSLAISGNQLTIAAPAGITDIYQIEVSVSDGVSVATRTFALTVRSSVTPPPDNSGLVGDFNGDGRQDSAEFKADGSLWISLNGSAAKTLWAQWSAATYWTSLGVMDVNGDGRDDIVGLNKNGKYYIAFSTGTNFSTQLWTSTTPPKDS